MRSHSGETPETSKTGTWRGSSLLILLASTFETRPSLVVLASTFETCPSLVVFCEFLAVKSARAGRSRGRARGRGGGVHVCAWVHVRRGPEETTSSHTARTWGSTRSCVRGGFRLLSELPSGSDNFLRQKNMGTLPVLQALCVWCQ